MKKLFALVAVLFVITAFGMTVLVHAGDMPPVLLGETIPEVSTDYEVPIDIDPTGTKALNLSATSLKMIYKATAKLTAGEDVRWSSSNIRVVRVDQNGNLTATGRGKAVVTATAGDGRTATCAVTVNYTCWQLIIKIFLFGWIWY